MTWLHKTIQFLNRPFPEDERKVIYYRNLGFIGLFVAFFLYIFQPFGFHNTTSNKLLVALAYGAITLIAGVLYDITLGTLLRKYFIKNRLTLGKWVLNIMGIILMISLANFIFAQLLEGSLEWHLFPKMIFATIAIGVFPVITLGAISMLRQEKKYQGIAQEINQKSIGRGHLVTNQSVQTIFGVPLNRVQYIEALQNYVRVVYLDEQEQLKEQIARATLKSILEEVAEGAIVRCHRSFLVNQELILSTSGNAQGLLLTLAGSDQEIPVSRSYVAAFRN
ncbi:MAG: LytTR family DNA-binding domain-containing protein [Saprospiraceae bacterium]